MEDHCFQLIGCNLVYNRKTKLDHIFLCKQSFPCVLLDLWLEKIWPIDINSWGQKQGDLAFSFYPRYQQKNQYNFFAILTFEESTSTFMIFEWKVVKPLSLEDIKGSFVLIFSLKPMVSSHLEDYLLYKCQLIAVKKIIGAI